ncbi:MAG: DUF6404 family protein [Planctomycetes bacterium]|nr:DUF6404 family protein [Planctomycetota bacterium]
MATHREAVRRYLEDMKSRGFSSWTCAPPLFRLLWALGLEIPPPSLLGSGARALLMGGIFVPVSFGILVALNGDVRESFFVSVFAGIVSVALLSSRIRRQARARNLPPWEHYRRD